MGIGTIRLRLANDFQLAVLTLLGSIALLGISPFTILRAINGEWSVFATDLFIQVGILGIVAHAWRSGRTSGPSIFLAYFIGTVVTVAFYVLGDVAKYWYYPSIVAIFFLVDRRNALLIALLSLVAAMFNSDVIKPTVDYASFFMTVIVCALFSYAFSYRYSIQRTQLETLVSKDELTGLFNRRTLLEDMESTRLGFEREQRSHGILLLDLDHFKQINDRYGHLTGDHVLIDIAHLLRQQMRQSDRVYRFGGEEFVILVPSPDHVALASIAEKLRDKVENGEYGPDNHSITTSIGGTMLRAGESCDEWFNRADAALYAAKSSGRNRVIIDSESVSASTGTGSINSTSLHDKTENGERESTDNSGYPDHKSDDRQFNTL
jgi:diguanylate cyclase (GGDEF)-like protein